MSSLDHGLVCANSLTGIGSIEEAIEALDPGSGGTNLFSSALEDSLTQAKDLLLEAANASEATKQEVLANAELLRKAKEAAAPTKLIFDAAVGLRLGSIRRVGVYSAQEAQELGALPDVVDALGPLMPAHLPYLFPEVFLREFPGFDVMLGNPPWKALVLHKNKFWGRYFSELSQLDHQGASLRVQEIELLHPELSRQYEYELAAVESLRAAVAAGPFAGINDGDPDLYKAFVWRFLEGTRANGTFGVVLPRSPWSTSGMSAWRVELMGCCETVVEFCTNKAGWIFPNVNHAYKVSLLTASKVGSGAVVVRAGIEGQESLMNRDSQILLSLDQLMMADTQLRIPALDTVDEIALWQHLAQSQRLSDGRQNRRMDIRCAPVTDIHATNVGKKLNIFTGNSNDHPVSNHRNIERFRFVSANGVFNYLKYSNELKRQQQVFLRGVKSAKSAFSLTKERTAPPAALPFSEPRIAYREVVHATNSRKVWAALVPAGQVLTHKAPYLVFGDTSIEAQAYLLGILNSDLVDWWASLTANLGLTFSDIYNLPVPEYSGGADQLRIGQIAAELAMRHSPKENFGAWQTLTIATDANSTESSLIGELNWLCDRAFGINREFGSIVHTGSNFHRAELSDVEVWY